MDVLRLPYGPWKPLLSGKYEGYDISLYQNPDRDLLSILVDVDEEGNPKGLVVIMYRAYLAEGPVNDLLTGTKLKTAVITKKRDAEIYQFLLLESGPKYVGLRHEDLIDALNRLGNALYKDNTALRSIARATGVTLTALRDVPKKVAALMLAEPIFLPQLFGMSNIPGTYFEKVLPLGKDRTGEVIKESALELSKTEIIGEHERARKRVFAILLENALLSGLPAIVLTTNAKRYERMNEPSSGDLGPFGITTMGFPRKIWDVGKDYYADLNVVDGDALAEMLGISRKQKAHQRILELIDARRGSIASIDDVLVAGKKEKFHNLRAYRILSHHKAVHAEIFGKNNVAPLLSASDVGEATIISLEKDVITPTAAQSLLEGLRIFLEKRGRTKRARAMLFIENADQIVPRVRSPITDALVRTIGELKDYGVGIVVEMRSEADVRKEIIDMMETTITTISNDEVGVRMLTKRPYRIKPRPLASNILI